MVTYGTPMTIGSTCPAIHWKRSPDSIIRFSACLQELESGSYKAMWQALCSGDFFHGEYCRKTKQGNELWLHAFYNPILGADGKPYKIIALLTDLSERKAMELALISAKNKAEAATAAKSAFLANIEP